MWKVFFQTGHDATPDGAKDSEYGVDQLVELAFDSDSAYLHDLASVVELMGWNYLLKINNDTFSALMQEDQPDACAPATRRPPIF